MDPWHVRFKPKWTARQTLAFDTLTGEQIWRSFAPETPLERVHESSSPAVSTPCVDQQRLYVYFGSFGLLCYNLDGKELSATAERLVMVDRDTEIESFDAG